MARFVLLAFSCLVLFCSCYEEQEGCLDPAAVNYVVSADINADCEYPSLSFSVSHVWGDSIYSPDSFYYDADSTPYQIRFLGLFVRELEVDTGLRWTLLNPKLRTWPLQRQDLVETTEAVGFIQSRNFETDWGQLDFLGVFQGIRLTIGLGPLETVDPNALESNHPLNIRPQMFDTLSERYHGWVFQYRTDTAEAAEVFRLKSLPQQEISWMQSVEGRFPPAVNSQIFFDLDYQALFSDFRVADSPDRQRQVINENWSEALTVRTE